MERITTNRLAYFNEIRKELLNTPPCNNRNPIFIFCEIGQLLTHGFAIHFFTGERNFLFLKQWNAAYDNERFSLGIYNLDRLAITTHYIILNYSDLLEINRLLKSHLHIRKSDTFILDGLYCEIIFDELTLQWNTEEEMNPALSALVRFIKDKIMKALFYK